MISIEKLAENHNPRRPEPEFNRERLIAACKYKGLVDDLGMVDPRRVHSKISDYVIQQDGHPPTLRTVSRWLSGAHDPCRGAPGRLPWIFTIAAVLGFSVDWLTQRGKW